MNSGPDTPRHPDVPPTDITLHRLRRALERLAPRLAEADPDDQEQALDEAILAIGLDPSWAQWWAYAAALLPAYRKSAG